jgi:hypothetical protein
LLPCDFSQLQRFFQETRKPIWRPYQTYAESGGIDQYGEFDLSRFSELEMRMYSLIKAKLASKFELDNCYTLDEALKLYALYSMERDIEAAHADEIKNQRGRR